ncbi:MAG: polysaccharide biosynthesis tyrosine autokinase, partial [Acidimicrobiia bacterium]
MERNEELNLIDAIAVIRRRWWVILAAALLCGSLTYVYFDRQVPKYRSYSVLLIDVRTAARISAAAGTSGAGADGTRILLNQVEFAKGAVVRDEVAARMGGPVELSVSAADETDVLIFGAVDVDATRAANAVNTYVAVHQQFVSDQAAQAYEEALGSIDEVLVPLQQRLAELIPVTTATTPAETQALEPTLVNERKRIEGEISSLETKKTAIRLSASLDKDVVTKVISAGEIPSAPFTPLVKRNAAIGFLAGLVLSIALVFVADYLDDRLRDRAAITRAARGLPILALVPRDRRAARGRGSLAAEPGAVGEAVRGLRTGVQFASLQQPLRSILVTSARPREGKTTIAVSLAVALAHSGTPTVLIDADLRKPRAHKALGMGDPGGGLSSVLQGTVSVASALRNAPGVANLLVIPAGPPPANAADLLAAGSVGAARLQLKAVIDELVRAGYAVVVDAPPVLPVADALTVSRSVDGVVFVLAAGSARVRDVTRAFELLDHAGATVVGVTVNKLSRSGGGYGREYGYGYGTNGRSGGGSGKRSTVNGSTAPAPNEAALDLVDLRATLASAGATMAAGSMAATPLPPNPLAATPAPPSA